MTFHFIRHKPGALASVRRPDQCAQPIGGRGAALRCCGKPAFAAAAAAYCAQHRRDPRGLFLRLQKAFAR